MNHRLTRIAACALITTGTFAATLAGAAQSASPALADGWNGHGPADRHDDQHDRGRGPGAWHDGWHDRNGWHGHGYGGPRYYDRQHGYWRDRFGYWTPAGAYITFRL